MRRRIPVFSTIVVVAAAMVMVGLGIWQLQRAQWKEALLARYSAAVDSPEKVAWPSPPDYEKALYHRATVNCRIVRGFDNIAGRSANGANGWAHIARCTHDGQGVADVAIGWSREANPPAWSGGKVTGVIAPYGRVVRLVSETSVADLQPLARPDPQDMPNNHLAYAGQWFFFALVALVIYTLALRKRWREG